jgi:hypothetical protein
MHDEVTTTEFAGYLDATVDLRELPRLLVLSDDVRFPRANRAALTYQENLLVLMA